MADDNRGGEPIRAPDESGNWSTIKQIAGALKVYLSSLLAGEDQFNNLIRTASAAPDYKVLVANAADQVCGAVGAAGDYLHDIQLSVTAAGTIVIKDGSTTIFTHNFTAAQAVPVTIPVARFSVTGAWRITTPLGITGHAGGSFS